MLVSTAPESERYPMVPAVGGALGGLELRDDLHGANLGRTGDRAAGECRSQQVHGVVLRRELAHHGGDEVVDRGVVLDGRTARHATVPRGTTRDRSFRRRSTIHHVLGPVLVTLHERARELPRRARGEPPGTRALDGPRLDSATWVHP